MATITITVGAVTATRTVTNAKASRVLQGAATGTGFVGDPAASPQAALDHLLDQVVAFVVSAARGQEERAAMTAAVAAVAADPPTWANGT